MYLCIDCLYFIKLFHKLICYIYRVSRLTFFHWLLNMQHQIFIVFVNFTGIIIDSYDEYFYSICHLLQYLLYFASFL